MNLRADLDCHGRVWNASARKQRHARIPSRSGRAFRRQETFDGLKNTGMVAFEYISITSPPINFSYAYQREA
jgi:hypothetical protein